jgi:hypothetical protein
VLDTTPFSDNQAGHLGTGFFSGLFGGSDAKISGHFEIDQNGSPIAAGNPVNSRREEGLRRADRARQPGRHARLLSRGGR